MAMAGVRQEFPETFRDPHGYYLVNEQFHLLVRYYLSVNLDLCLVTSLLRLLKRGVFLVSSVLGVRQYESSLSNPRH